MNCPRLHYQPDHSFLIRKHLHSVSIEQRAPFNERRGKKINSRGSLAYSLAKIVRFNVDFNNDYSNSNEAANEEGQEEKGPDTLLFEAAKEISITDLSGREGVGKKKENGGKGKKDEAGGEEAGKKISLMLGEEDEGTGEGVLRRRDVKLIPQEIFHEEGEEGNGSCYGSKKMSTQTQNLVDNIYIEKEDGVGGRGIGKKSSIKLTQNIEGSLDGERFSCEKEKSKVTYNFSERCGSDITTNDGKEKLESILVKAYSKEEHLNK